MNKVVKLLICIFCFMTMCITSFEQEVNAKTSEKVICINAGHQAKGDNSKEAVGPGSKTKKAKVTTGATGVSSKKKESTINLEVAKLLKTELQSRGYKVIMTRTSQNVNLSNQQRAKIGNKADLTISLHCDSSTSSKVTGAHTISIAKNNPYCKNLYSKSSSLAKAVINAYCEATGIKNRGVSYRNDLTGLNWSKVPAIYIEMGFLSNKTEDKKLASATFQKKCAQGIANGIDKYYGKILVSKLTIKGAPKTKEYTGKQIKPSISVYNGKTKLKVNTDYVVSYGTNKNLGTGTIKITGKGKYGGTKTISFKIVKKVSKLSYSKIKNQKYTGKQIKPAITVYDGKTKLKNKTDYTISYGKNKSGTGTIKITGKGKYTGTKTISFKIIKK